MIDEILNAFLFFLPAGVANMSPVLFKRVRFLDIPISCKYFGAHKTYRGFLFGILMAVLTVQIQRLIGLDGTYIDYSSKNLWLIGFLSGFGALFGDMVKSFFKRKIGIAPGKDWFFFDQVDWIFGASLFLMFYVGIELEMFLIILVLFSSLHIFMNFLRKVLSI